MMRLRAWIANGAWESASLKFSHRHSRGISGIGTFASSEGSRTADSAIHRKGAAITSDATTRNARIMALPIVLLRCRLAVRVRRGAASGRAGGAVRVSVGIGASHDAAGQEREDHQEQQQDHRLRTGQPHAELLE